MGDFDHIGRKQKQKQKENKKGPESVSNQGAKGKSPRLQELQLYLLKTVHIHLDANPRTDVSGNAVLGQSWTSKASSVLTWVFQCKPLGHTARWKLFGYKIIYP